MLAIIDIVGARNIVEIVELPGPVRFCAVPSGADADWTVVAVPYNRARKPSELLSRLLAERWGRS